MKPPAWIAQLAREGSVAHSQVRPERAALLDQLQALRLVAVETQGSHRRLIVSDPLAFATWVAGNYPDAVAAPVTGLRAANIARARQSKAGPATHAAQPLLLRWFSPDPTDAWAALTRRCGIIGVTSDRLAALALPTSWTLLTVENWEPFLALDYAPQGAPIVALFTGGNIAERALHALAVLQPPPAQAIHFGDYDWAGLAIYRRIRATLPLSTLYVPATIDALFRDFAGHGLLAGQLPLAPRQDDPAEVRQVIALIAAHNAGLEQEIVPPPEL